MTTWNNTWMCAKYTVGSANAESIAVTHLTADRKPLRWREADERFSEAGRQGHRSVLVLFTQVQKPIGDRGQQGQCFCSAVMAQKPFGKANGASELLRIVLQSLPLNLQTLVSSFPDGHHLVQKSLAVVFDDPLMLLHVMVNLFGHVARLLFQFAFCNGQSRQVIVDVVHEGFDYLVHGLLESVQVTAVDVCDEPAAVIAVVLGAAKPACGHRASFAEELQLLIAVFHARDVGGPFCDFGRKGVLLITREYSVRLGSRLSSVRFGAEVAHRRRAVDAPERDPSTMIGAQVAAAFIVGRRELDDRRVIRGKIPYFDSVATVTCRTSDDVSGVIRLLEGLNARCAEGVKAR